VRPVRPSRLSRIPEDRRRQERIAHLGLGSFFRAHQAWYTDRAPDAAQWGIRAFGGRGGRLAETLACQDGLYTLVTRDREADRFELVRSLTHVVPAADHGSWLDCARDDALAVITMTVTENGYHLADGRSLDEADRLVRRDVEALRQDQTTPVATAPARLLAALVARQRAGGPPVAVVPCDNLPDNGRATATAVRDLAWLVDPALVGVVDDMASFVTTVVDRITPRPTEGDRDLVTEQTGVLDAAPVVTEPFTEWVLAGQFPSGRPAWEASGATFADRVEPFEQRKLWMLNAAHSLLAYAAPTRGHTTVAQAIGDPVCRGWVEDLWDEASRHVSLPTVELDVYRGELMRRFANDRMRHQLAQIAADGSQKLPARVLPVLRSALAEGRVPVGVSRVVAAWICHLRGGGTVVSDPQADHWTTAARGDSAQAVSTVLGLLAPDLAGHRELVEETVAKMEELCS
jgi:fructuronate reductase